MYTWLQEQHLRADCTTSAAYSAIFVQNVVFSEVEADVNQAQFPIGPKYVQS